MWKGNKMTITETYSILKEPEIAYEKSGPTLKAILGGKLIHLDATHNEIDFIKLTRKGLKKEVLGNLAAYLGISMPQISDLLHTSYRNLLRKDSNDVLDSYKTEKVLELASFTLRGIEVLGTKELFQEWLQSPIMSLGNKKPLEFLDTTFGIQLVLKILGRLEQGVYS